MHILLACSGVHVHKNALTLREGVAHRSGPGGLRAACCSWLLEEARPGVSWQFLDNSNSIHLLPSLTISLCIKGSLREGCNGCSDCLLLAWLLPSRCHPCCGCLPTAGSRKSTNCCSCCRHAAQMVAKTSFAHSCCLPQEAAGERQQRQRQQHARNFYECRRRIHSATQPQPQPNSSPNHNRRRELLLLVPLLQLTARAPLQQLVNAQPVLLISRPAAALSTPPHLLNIP